jgi:hypothetical protein
MQNAEFRMQNQRVFFSIQHSAFAGCRRPSTTCYGSSQEDDRAHPLSAPLTSIDVIELGGAVSRVRPDDTAFGQRSAPYLVAIEANWDDPAADGARVSWVIARELRVCNLSSG